MTALNTVMHCFTGPRRLRSVLRHNTAPIHHLLESLNGPTELRVSIPASVFGGDIFGVMSKHLREALVCPPPQHTSALRATRPQHLLRSAENPPFQNPLNAFPRLGHNSKISTFPGELPDSTSATTLTSALPEQKIGRRRLRDFSLEQQSSRSFAESYSHEKSTAWPSGNTDLTDVPKDGRSPAVAPALISSLRRYWESIPEKHEKTRGQSPTWLTESPSGVASFPISEPEQRTALRAWPVTGSDVAEKLRAFSAGSHPSLKPARIYTTDDHQIQNVFNIEVKNANHQAQTYDDLGERIAEILHEQALQHGIDVT